MSDYPCRSCGESVLVEHVFGLKVVMTTCGVCCRHSEWPLLPEQPSTSDVKLTRDGQYDEPGYGHGV